MRPYYTVALIKFCVLEWLLKVSNKMLLAACCVMLLAVPHVLSSSAHLDISILLDAFNIRTE